MSSWTYNLPSDLINLTLITTTKTSLYEAVLYSWVLSFDFNLQWYHWKNPQVVDKLSHKLAIIAHALECMAA